MRRTYLVVFATALLSLVSFTGAATAAGSRVPVRGTAAPGQAGSTKIGDASATTPLSFAVTLPLRNRQALDRLIASVSDPSSPQYGRYLTPAQFKARFAPSDAQVNRVTSYLRSQGLSVSGVSSNNTVIDASGQVSDVQRAFATTIARYHDPHLRRDYHANASQLSLPQPVAADVLGVIGLSNHFVHTHPPLPKTPGPRAGAGPGGGYTPSQLKTAYDINPLAGAGFTGSGQRVGLFELAGYKQSNITSYDNQYALASPAPTVVNVDGGNTTLGNSEVEVELDIEVVQAIAPAANITVFEGPNSDQGVIDTYNQMAASNTTPANSTSWGLCEPDSSSATINSESQVYAQMAVQGQGLFAASGDSAAYDCGTAGQLAVDNPADDPNVTGAGGTNLQLDASNAYQSETPWDTNSTDGGGGGVSTLFAKPSWQTSTPSACTKRCVPDIASDADPATGYSIFTRGAWNVVGGTSAAAPMWAGFSAVYNQDAAANGKPNLGYANPALYNLAHTTQSFTPFHDVTTGHTSTSTNWPAQSGYDMATGLGTYDANNVARDLLGGGGTTPSPPTITQTFGGSSVPLGGSTSLTFKVTNPNATTALTGIGFSDALPSGLMISTPNGETGSCGAGTIAATQGTSAISLSGASLAGGASCSFSVSVIGTAAGAKSNSTGPVGSDQTGAGKAASATLTVQSGAGNWPGSYGAAGYVLAGWSGTSDLAALPGGVGETLQQGSRYTWSAASSDARALQSPDGSTRKMTTYYAATQVQVQLSFPSAYSGNLHLYALDADNKARRESITVNDGSGGQTVHITTDFSQGAWATFPISVPANGTVSITVIRDAGVNAVVSGIMLGDSGTTPQPAYQSPPQGSWTGTYGSAGYVLAGWNGSSDLASLPGGAGETLRQGARWVWASATTDPRGLQSPDGTTRKLTTYYAATQVQVQLSFASAYSGNLHLYALDADQRGRRESIAVNDGSSSQTVHITTDFSQGAWTTFPISVPANGTVSITVTRDAGVNAVLSGIMLGDSGPPPSPTTGLA